MRVKSDNCARTRRIPELDGLRAIAVLLVLIYHMLEFSRIIPGIDSLAGRTVISLGAGGVHLFFVISGFIITSLLIHEKNTTGSVSLTAFYIRRFLRIIPPFAVYLFVIFLLGQLGYLSTTPVNFLWSILFLTNWDVMGNLATPGSWFLAHTWSLSVEEQYYLVLPPLMASVFQFRARPLSVLIIGLFIVCLVSPKAGNYLALNVHPYGIKLVSLYQFRYILAGVLMALNRIAIQKLVTDTSGLLPIVGVGLIVLIAKAGSLTGFLFLTLQPIEVFLQGFLVMWVISNPAKCRFLRWRWVQWIGACSYSLYLWQQLFTGKAEFYNGWSIAQSPLVAIVCILGCTALSYYFIERPTIQLSKTVTKGIGTTVVPSTKELAV